MKFYSSLRNTVEAGAEGIRLAYRDGVSSYLATDRDTLLSTRAALDAAIRAGGDASLLNGNLGRMFDTPTISGSNYLLPLKASSAAIYPNRPKTYPVLDPSVGTFTVPISTYDAASAAASLIYGHIFTSITNELTGREGRGMTPFEYAQVIWSLAHDPDVNYFSARTGSVVSNAVFVTPVGTEPWTSANYVITGLVSQPLHPNSDYSLRHRVWGLNTGGGTTAPEVGDMVELFDVANPTWANTLNVNGAGFPFYSASSGDTNMWFRTQARVIRNSDNAILFESVVSPANRYVIMGGGGGWMDV